MRTPAFHRRGGRFLDFAQVQIEYGNQSVSDTSNTIVADNPAFQNCHPASHLTESSSDSSKGERQEFSKTMSAGGPVQERNMARPPRKGLS